MAINLNFADKFIPYQPTASEQVELNSYTDWDDFNRALKDKIYDYYNRQQKSRCNYCRLKVIKSGPLMKMDIEHILNKKSSLYKKLTFEPLNWCLACKNCNTKKSTKDNGTASLKKKISVNTDYKMGDYKSNDFEYINPYYDKYSDHIELIGDIIPNGITAKGIKTVSDLELGGYWIVLGHSKALIERTKDYSSLVVKLTKSSLSQSEQNKIIEEIRLALE